ncbi:hypothetical protein ATANTOWER_013833 [Ataeniobius toweri]|uniref:Uncharacterized protein n=1 Tax=Ataeniobius toweri TaxID=208326 RepID=A0ABU7BR54_9TELE|nr:hypothetical protein [Ataeniobius toweri]
MTPQAQITSLAHSSLQNISSSIRLDERGLCTAIFRSLRMSHQIQVWTLAGPLQDIHRVVLRSWLWASGCCPAEKMNGRSSLRSKTLWSRFSCRMSLYIAAFIFYSILTSLPVSALKNIPIE